jgi:selenocysteine-specific elongation factor
MTPVAPTRSVVMGTAGHIDHGKTTLVLALTGTDTDRLPEEKSRGITIDLGFAVLTLKDGEGRTVDLSIIDVPGHHAFIRNMLAGAGGIDFVLLVIAADEGIKAQTEEHLSICSLLGIRYGIIALTKKDAVSAERLEQVRDEVRGFVKHTFLEKAPVIAVSARTREGLDDLESALLQLALIIPERNQDRLLRLPLDRAFSIRGFGTVVTGTLHAGSVQTGDPLELQTKGRPVRVRGIQVHNRAVSEAHAPARVALNLAGIEVAEVLRGDTVVRAETLSPVSTVDVELTVLANATALRHRSQVHMHAFTSETLARVLLYDSESGGTEGKRLARLRLTKPMLLLPGDQFVLRQSSPAQTVGGGCVLDARPLPRLKKSITRGWLEEIRGLYPGQQILARVRRRRVAGISIADLSQETGLNGEALRKLTTALVGQLIGVKVEHAHLDWFLEPQALVAAVDSLFKQLMQNESRSISHAEMRSKTHLQEWVFDLAVEKLLETKPVNRLGNEFTLKERSSAAGARTEVLVKIEELYRSAGLASPIVDEVASMLRMSQKDVPPLITLLVRSGKLVRLSSDDLLFHADALAKLKAELLKQRGQIFDVGRFKSFTGLTRKHAIPLLEYLDRVRVTVNRQGIRTVL